MRITIETIHGPAEITTDHPRSSYGQPVLVHGGRAYGPEDLSPHGESGTVANSTWGDSIRCSTGWIQGLFPQAEHDAVEQWLRTSPRVAADLDDEDRRYNEHRKNDGDFGFGPPIRG